MLQRMKGFQCAVIQASVLLYNRLHTAGTRAAELLKVTEDLAVRVKCSSLETKWARMFTLEQVARLKGRGGDLRGSLAGFYICHLLAMKQCRRRPLLIQPCSCAEPLE